VFFPRVRACKHPGTPLAAAGLLALSPNWHPPESGSARGQLRHRRARPRVPLPSESSLQRNEAAGSNKAKADTAQSSHQGAAGRGGGGVLSDGEQRGRSSGPHPCPSGGSSTPPRRAPAQHPGRAAGSSGTGIFSWALGSVGARRC